MSLDVSRAGEHTHLRVPTWEPLVEELRETRTIPITIVGMRGGNVFYVPGHVPVHAADRTHLVERR